jgi:anti-sigma B factor antagonist
MNLAALSSSATVPRFRPAGGLTAYAAQNYTPPPSAVNHSPSILVGCNQKVVCIRVQGKGSFQNSAGVKRFAKAMVNRGFRDFVVDLADCPVMDSTFMGTLTGIAFRLRELGHGGLHVINSNERNTNLLEGLGLDQILSLENGSGDSAAALLDSDLCADDELPADPVDKRAATETMIAAHQALVDADPQNFCKFKDVIEYLKQDLHQEELLD